MLATGDASRDDVPTRRKFLMQTLGPYQLLSRLGVGATSRVYRARRGQVGPELALKVLLGDLAADPEWLGRFRREAFVLSRLRHPNAVALLDWGEADGQWYLALELVEGRLLGEWVGSRPGARFLMRVGAQLASGLAAAHDLGLVHRDLKPANVLVRADGLLKILDFGLARPGLDESPFLPTTLHSLTTPGAVLGTPRYMSPEQSLGETVTAASDLFCLGLCLYELATGSHPFASPSARDVQLRIRENPIPSLQQRRPDLPGDWILLVEQLLAKDPGRRSDAATVARTLAAMVREETVG